VKLKPGRWGSPSPCAGRERRQRAHRQVTLHKNTSS
jgi:hypothetical protein